MIIIFNFIIIFVVIDTLFQFFNKQDIFGFELDYNKAYGRLSGPFGDEFIVGFFLFSIGYINFYLINKFIKSNKLYDFLYLLILPLVIFLSGERATFLSYLLFTSFLIFLNKENRKKILFYNIVLLFSVMLILQNFKPLNNRYSLSIITSTYASYETSDEVTNIEEKLKETNEINLYNKIKIYKELISNTLWFSHFRGAAEIFNNNLFFGSGFKTFRYECRKINNPRSKNIICTSHPHNIYFELVSDTGLAGLLIFIIIVFKFSFDFFKKSNFRNFPSSIIFSLLISFIFPFKPHGSIFTTNYAFMLWFIISFLIYDFYFKNKLK